MRALKLSRALKLCPVISVGAGIPCAFTRYWDGRVRLIPVKELIRFWDAGGRYYGNLTDAQQLECREFMRLRKGKGRW
jgi:hypothetical protein